jgi:hypothetical protein
LPATTQACRKDTTIQGSGFTLSQLDYLLRNRFNPSAFFVPLDSALASTLTVLRADLLNIDAAEGAERQKLQRSAVIDRVSAVIALPGDVTASLVERVTHSGCAFGKPV